MTHLVIVVPPAVGDLQLPGVLDGAVRGGVLRVFGLGCQGVRQLQGVAERRVHLHQEQRRLRSQCIQSFHLLLYWLKICQGFCSWGGDAGAFTCCCIGSKYARGFSGAGGEGENAEGRVHLHSKERRLQLLTSMAPNV